MTNAFETLPPEAYEGQPLCERCGVDDKGQRFATCAEIDPKTGQRYAHERACSIGRRYNDLCKSCDQIMRAEYPREYA